MSLSAARFLMGRVGRRSPGFRVARRFMCATPEEGKEEDVIVPGEIVDESTPKEYSPKIQKIVDDIAELNLMEVTELVDLLTVCRRPRFGLSLHTSHTHTQNYRTNLIFQI